MVKLPQISAKDIKGILIRIGFHEAQQKGSHIKFVRRKFDQSKEIIIIPNHKVLRKGTLHNILKKVDLSIEKLKELL